MSSPTALRTLARAAALLGMGGLVAISRAELLPLADSLPPVKESRVVVSHNAHATESYQPVTKTIEAMVEASLADLMETNSATAAWQALVSPDDVVGIKVYSAPGPRAGTRPAVAAAVVESLLKAGHPPENVILWDKEMPDLLHAGFGEISKRLGIKLAASVASGFDRTKFYEAPFIGHLIWGDLEFLGTPDEKQRNPDPTRQLTEETDDQPGRKSFVTKLLTERITKIITISPLLNHNQAGTSGHLYSLALGSIDNTFRFDIDVHRLATAVPEIFAMELFSDRLVLCVTDALLGQYEGQRSGLLHYSTSLNELWFSRDPVALDVLALDELDRQRQLYSATPPSLRKGKDARTIFENAALLDLGVNDTRRMKIHRISPTSP